MTGCDGEQVPELPVREVSPGHVGRAGRQGGQGPHGVRQHVQCRPGQADTVKSVITVNQNQTFKNVRDHNDEC